MFMNTNQTEKAWLKFYLDGYGVNLTSPRKTMCGQNVADLGIPRSPAFGHHHPEIKKNCDNVHNLLDL